MAKEEYQWEWVDALALCGVGYEKAGLLWAARANYLMAANQTLSEYWKHGNIVSGALRSLQNLIWIELQLGRIFYALAWLEVASAIAHQLMLDGDRKEAFDKERNSQDLVLGLLLLKTDIWELKELDFLPNILDDFGFYHSRMAVLYALGHENYLRSEGTIPESESTQAVRDFFVEWLNQPANEDLPEQPELQRTQKVELLSFVLGCEVIVEAENCRASIYLAETILSTLEALLATSLDGEILPYRSELRISIHQSDFTKGVPIYEIDESDVGQTVTVRHGAIDQQHTAENQDGFNSWLKEFTLRITCQFAVINDLESFAKQTFCEELGMGRALLLSRITVAVENILGHAPKFRLSDWKAQSAGERFSLNRDSAWNHGLEQRDESEEAILDEFKPGEGEAPDNLFGIDNLRHKDRRVLSFINMPLWDKANWSGTAYMCNPNKAPILVLGFKNPEAAKLIFKEWRNKLGEIDEEEQLRVSIITGIDKKHPSTYTVVISTNPKIEKNSQTQHFITIVRFNRMTPHNLKNLNIFLEHYNRAGRYIIMSAHLIAETKPPELLWEFGIGKSKLRVCPAWQVGENDPDVCAIRPEEDDPIIPEDVKDAPVIRALQRFEKQNRRKAHIQ